MSDAHGERAHAELGGSSCERWWTCPGSIKLSRGIKSETSIFAEWGTAAHELSEACLKEGKEPEELLGKFMPNGIAVDEEMIDTAKVYVDYVKSLMKKAAWHEIEGRFDLSRLNPPAPMFGSGDFLYYIKKTKTLGVVDLKGGQGVVVEPTSKQLRYYALAALMRLQDEGLAIEFVHATIVQPRAPHPDGPIRTAEYSVAELLDFSIDLIDAARATMKEDPVLKAGNHCRFCPANGICPELREHSLRGAQVDFDDPPQPEDLDGDQLCEILEKADIIEGWIRAVRAYAHQQLEQGNEIPGWKLVMKRALRKWRDEVTAEGRLKELGLDDDQMFTKKIITPAQADKILGKKQKGEIADYWEKQSSGTTLAPETDSRQSVTTAEADFGDLDDVT